MAVWPPTIRPVYPYSPRELEFVKKNPSESGLLQTRDIWGRLRFIADMTLQLTQADSQTFMTFWRANRVGTFYFFDFRTDAYTGLPMEGVTDGANKTFTIPGVRTTALTYYDDAAPVTGTWSEGTGVNGEDEIVLDSAPADPSVMTVDFTGWRRYVVRFADSPTPQLPRFGRQEIGTSVVEDFS